MATQTYYELLEMMQAEAKPRPRHICPICRLVVDGVDRYLKLLSLENVNDYETRQQLRQAGGFCNRHAYTWLKLHDALGTAIIYEDMLREVRRRITDGDFNSRRGSGLFKKLGNNSPENPFAPCPACLQQQKVDERVVSDFAEGYNHKAEFREAYAAHHVTGLCLPHFRRVLIQLNEAQSGQLANEQGEKLAATQATLREIIEKMDASRHPDPADRRIGEEREALGRAIWQIVGLEDLD